MLFNITKKQVLFKDILFAKTFFQRLKGFMFVFNPKKAVIFEEKKETTTLLSVHSFFVFFPVLLVYLDNQNRVVDLFLLKPFSFYNQRKKAKTLIEIPAFDEKILKKISLKDKISLKK